MCRYHVPLHSAEELFWRLLEEGSPSSDLGALQRCLMNAVMRFLGQQQSGCLCVTACGAVESCFVGRAHSKLSFGMFVPTLFSCSHKIDGAFHRVAILQFSCK